MASEHPRRWLLYGANGFTGVLIAEEAKRRGLAPILAGRREDAIRPLAERLHLPYRVFRLDDAPALEAALAEAGTVLLAAGPFSATSRPVVDACLRMGAHYVDITGEIAVLESCHARDQEARARGCVLLPGAGFDVVPSDCLAAELKQALPDATHLELAFVPPSRPSRGTARSMFEALPYGNAVRVDGQIRREPFFARVRTVPFRDRPRTAVAVPWGDVSTAYYSTGIPNVAVYMAFPGPLRPPLLLLRLLRPLLPLTGSPAVQRLLLALANRLAEGPSAEQRRTATAQLWGRVHNAAGRSLDGTLITPEPYELTARTAVECARRVAAGEVSPGFHTPATAFGPRFITEFDRCDLRVPASPTA